MRPLFFFLVVTTICTPGLSISRLPDICLSFFCFVCEGESLLFRITITPSPRTPVLVILLSYTAFPLLLFDATYCLGQTSYLLIVLPYRLLFRSCYCPPL